MFFWLKYRIGDIPCYRWGKRATGVRKRSERWAVGSGERAVLIVETLVTPHCPPPTAHHPGFRVRAKLGIGFPTGGTGCLPFYIRAVFFPISDPCTIKSPLKTSTSLSFSLVTFDGEVRLNCFLLSSNNSFNSANGKS